MAKTLLAVDDSATMRKVLEITFSGEDFRVITAENSQAAYGKLAESPAVIVVDTMLGGEDGYAVAKELHWRSPDAAIILLASRYSPYDLARGRDAGADDWADKPFDTQQLIDKVRKIVHAKEASGTGGGRVVQATTSSSHPYRERAAAMPPPIPSSSHSVSPPARPAARASAGAASSPQRSATSTLVFGDGQQAPPPLPTSAASQPTPVAAASAPAIASAVNGQLGAKLGELGLTPTQAEAVLALSRQVVERVVWEVVPQLAETMIKEEITRLTKE